MCTSAHQRGLYVCGTAIEPRSPPALEGSKELQSVLQEGSHSPWHETAHMPIALCPSQLCDFVYKFFKSLWSPVSSTEPLPWTRALSTSSHQPGSIGTVLEASCSSGRAVAPKPSEEVGRRERRTNTSEGLCDKRASLAQRPISKRLCMHVAPVLTGVQGAWILRAACRSPHDCWGAGHMMTLRLHAHATTCFMQRRYWLHDAWVGVV